MIVIPENMPALDTEPYRGTLPQLLSVNLGKRIRADFFLDGRVVSHAGILDAVADRYLVLHRPEDGAFVACDIAALKFFTVLP